MQQPPLDMLLHPYLASIPLKRSPLARGKRTPNALSIVGWFCQSGAQFVQLEVGDLQGVEEVLVQGLSVLASTR
jgi:hypothetical protein